MGKKETKGELVLYQPNGTLKLDVYLEDETVWLTQKAMAELFNLLGLIPRPLGRLRNFYNNIKDG